MPYYDTYVTYDMLHTYRTMTYFEGKVKYISQDSTLKILRMRPTKDTLLY